MVTEEKYLNVFAKIQIFIFSQVQKLRTAQARAGAGAGYW
jgi:hypothetical protein